MSTSSTDIHGHDILHLVHDHAQKTPFTRASLQAHVNKTYGADALFCTCHGGGMTFNQLLDFLLSRGKIVEENGQLVTIMAKVCSGGEHHHDD